MPRATHILHLPIIGQRTAWECGNTVLTSVLQYHRKPYSVDRLRELAHTKTTGTDHGNMIEAAMLAGANVFARANAGTRKSMHDLIYFIDRGLPVIVGWWSMWPGPKFGQYDVDFDKRWKKRERKRRDAGHYSVLRGYTPSTLLFMDPQDGYHGDTIGYCEWADFEFTRLWYDTDTDDFEPVRNWYMVLHFEEEGFAKKLRGGKDYSIADMQKKPVPRKRRARKR